VNNTVTGILLDTEQYHEGVWVVWQTPAIAHPQRMAQYSPATGLVESQSGYRCYGEEKHSHPTGNRNSMPL